MSKLLHLVDRLIVNSGILALSQIRYLWHIGVEKSRDSIRDWKAINKSVSRQMEDTPSLHFGTPPEKPKNMNSYSSFIFSGNESPKLEKASKDTPTVKSEDDGYRNTKPYCETP